MKEGMWSSCWLKQTGGSARFSSRHVPVAVVCRHKVSRSALMQRNCALVNNDSENMQSNKVDRIKLNTARKQKAVEEEGVLE